MAPNLWGLNNMPIAKFQMEDGRVARFEVPEGTTPEQAQSMMQEHFAPQQTKKPEPSTWENIKRSAGLTARSGIEGVGDVVGIAQNPLAAMTGGAIRRSSEVYPELATRLRLPQPESSTEKIAGAGVRGLVGAGSMVGAGGQLARLPGMVGQMGSVLSTAPAAQITSGATGGMSAQTAQEMGAGPTGQAIAGISGALAPTAAARVLPAIGSKVADVVGGLGTHTGGESLRQAARAGLKGGQTQTTFTENMRGGAQMDDVLTTAKTNLQNMGAQRAAAYKQGMGQVSGDKTILDFQGIDDAINKSAGMATYKGQVKNTQAAKALQEISDEVNAWKGLNPKEFHTPEGLDALKQKIGGIVESIPFEQKTARTAASNIYNSIKSEITKQAPVYSKVMKGYSDATDQIKEIERALSLGGKASTDTAMRKLQSLMRNNVNTNYGNRLDLARSLEQQGGNEILPALAGQSLSSWTPRGLGGAVAGGVGLGGYAVGGAPLAIPMLAGQSPRLMGETALKLGQAGRGLSSLANPQLDAATLKALLYGGMGANQ